MNNVVRRGSHDPSDYHTILGHARPLSGCKCRGCGEICDFCAVTIARLSAEFEVEADLEGERLTLHFHSRCYDAWWGVRSPWPAPDRKLAR